MLMSTNRVLMACCILCLCTLSGCAAVIIGAGAAGAGAFAYSEGRLSRMYAAGYQETVNATLDTLESLKIPVRDKTADELETNILAVRPDGTPVQVVVSRVGPKYSEVAIRTGKIGVFDKKTSHQIHDYILKKVGQISDASAADQGPSSPKAPQTAKEIGETVSKPETLSETARYPSDKLAVYFDVNTNKLSKEETNKLDRFFETNHKRLTAKIVVIGYSDATGTPIYNKMLSLSRAETVKMYLIGKGMPPDQIETYGHGSLNFVGDNDTEKGRRLNRRVEINISEN